MYFNFHKYDYKGFHEAFYLNKFNNEYIDDDNDDVNNNCYEEDFNFDEFCLPFSETIFEFVQDLLEEKFLIDDLSFLFEISRKHKLSPCAILLGMIYLKRLKYKSSSKCKYIYSGSELCLVSVLIACKYLIDEGETDEIYNDDWAKTANLSIERVNKLEKLMLNDLEWELYVSPDEFLNFTDAVHLKVLNKKIKTQNGACTYDDLKYLLDNLVFMKNTNNNLYHLLKIITTCLLTLSYTIYTSFIAYLVITQLKTILNVTNSIILKPHTSQYQSQQLNQTQQAIIIDYQSNNNLPMFKNQLRIENNTFESESDKLNFISDNLTVNNGNNQLNETIINNNRRFDTYCKTEANFNFIKQLPKLILVYEEI